MKKLVFFLVFFLLFSCDYLDLQSKGNEEIKKTIASVYNAKLYSEDLQLILPKNVTKQDSIVLVKNYINSWAKQQLLLKKAEENISEADNKSINNLVDTYKQSLYINDYKERLIRQQLDTVITNDELVAYYNSNKDNFKLNEHLVQLKYIQFGKNYLDKNDAVKKFKSTKDEDLEALENQLINFKSYQLRDSTWLTINEVLTKIAPFKTEPKEKLLKISKFIKIEDSLDVYLIAVQNVLKPKDIAPLSYIVSQIKQLVLHKRKLELIREIEKTLINDAIKNQHFKEY